jgi:hypothetical protein
MISFFKNIFSKKIDSKSKFDFGENQMEKIKDTNRNSLQLIENWIDESAFQNSFFNYGVPDFIKSDINKPIGSSLTYTDIMLYLSKKHFPEISYLELGVSVGKNFFQMLNGHAKGIFMGFDIEDINPVLESKLNEISKTEWPTVSGSIKKNNSSLKGYKFNDLDVSYMSADIWDQKSWARLNGSKYNIVFSDALHSPEAILFEFEMLVKNELLDQKFIIIWDDLVGKMRRSFYEIIRKYDKVYKINDIFLLNVNGWIGKNEPPHSVGIISNFIL